MSTRSLVLVILQFSCFIYFFLFADVITSGPGLILQIAAVFLCVWAVIIMKPGKFNVQPEVKTNAVFISKGPYRFIRNPMYLGLIVFFGVTIIYEPKLLNILSFFILLLVFIIKIQMEERYLHRSFGKEYEKYKKTTFRLIPYLYSGILIFKIAHLFFHQNGQNLFLGYIYTT
ncbi:MAG: isoprenylcysteine carboxylmethyltransferase family protein [Flavobacteriaceae bacterium]|nr:MAG: isoprenylcysteine carboxylmethyltransferase family protein [Flavobacteriaceae bacterium]